MCSCFTPATAILIVRRYVPESPRWMFIHGKEDEAEELVQDIEGQVEDSTDERLDGVDEDITVRQRKSIGFGEIAKTMVTKYPKRSALDTVDRKVMITMTYVTSGLPLILTGVLFNNDLLSATTLTAMWCAVFFFASAGANAAYLTVSEIFPMETRAMAIAFYAVGTGIGGIVGPVYFGKLIEQGRGRHRDRATTSVPG